jgi:hypothetical protein
MVFLTQVVEVQESATMESSNGHVFQLSVKQGEPTLVPPAEETEQGLYFLSNLDQNIAVIVRTIYCFKSEEKGNEKAGEVIKNALKKVLVHYYPLAGRLSISSEGKLIVDCSGEGAVFVEAEANCAMKEIGDITKPDPETLRKLVYDIPAAKNILEIPPLVAQVCKFLKIYLTLFQVVAFFLLLFLVIVLVVYNYRERFSISIITRHMHSSLPKANVFRMCVIFTKLNYMYISLSFKFMHETLQNLGDQCKVLIVSSR